jgi:hypothetical protein
VSSGPAVAFVIFRMNCYRVMAPAIAAALRRGWRVECWHDVGTPLPGRPFDFPSIERAPRFADGAVTFHEYGGRPGLIAAMRERGVDAMVSVLPALGAHLPEYPSPAERPFSVLLEPSPGDWFAQVRHPAELRQVDLYALTTAYWLEHDLGMMRDTLPFEWSAALEAEIREKTSLVGWPQADQRSLIDPVAVRRRWGLAAEQPVLVYFNWPSFGSWNLDIALFGATTAPAALRALIRHRREWRRAPTALRAVNLEETMRSLYRFAARNRALLLVKYRHRDILFRPELRHADLTIADEALYPHSINEVMSIASLSAGYFSFSVRESAAAGVPHLNLDLGGVGDTRWYGERGLPAYRRLAAPGGPWNHPGVTFDVDDTDLRSTLPEAALADFALDPLAGREYRQRFLGPSDRPNAELFLDAVEAGVCARAARQ